MTQERWVLHIEHPGQTDQVTFASNLELMEYLEEEGASVGEADVLRVLQPDGTTEILAARGLKSLETLILNGR